MIVNNVLNSVFANSTMVKVLRVISERPKGVSGRETARLAKVSLRSTQISLQNLENLKIVNKFIGGRENTYSLNRNNYLSKEIIISIFNKEKEFKRKIVKTITTFLNAATTSIILFGSVARSEELYDSDYDICIVYKNQKTKLTRRIDELRDILYEKYGITLAPYLISEKTFVAKAKRNESPVNSIIAEGKLLSGTPIKRLLNG